MYKSIKASLLFILSLCLFSCTKEETPALVTTNTRILTTGTWVYHNTDGTYSEADKKGTVYNGTWNFLNNETQIRVFNSFATALNGITQRMALMVK